MKEIKRLNNERFPEPIGAYSNGLSIAIGDKHLVVLTGQVAIDATGRALHENEPGEQTRVIFENIDSLLHEAGGSLKDLIRVVIYVTDMNDFKAISPVRNQFLEKIKPVSTLVEVSNLTIPGCKVEIEATAII